MQVAREAHRHVVDCSTPILADDRRPHRPAPARSIDAGGRARSPRPFGARPKRHRWWSLPLTLAFSAMFVVVVAADQPQVRRGPERWEETIRKFEEQDRQTPPPPHPIVFVGSSSIRMWDLKKFFPELPVLNRGFGGSEISDAIHFADRIVVKYRPRCIVLYAGDNDIARGKSPQRVAADFRRFVERIRRDLPETPILYIAIKPSIARWKLWPKMREANRLIAEYCRQQPAVTFIDIATPMLEHGQPPPRELFIADGLHLSEKGYRLWADRLRPHLRPFARPQQPSSAPAHRQRATVD